MILLVLKILQLMTHPFIRKYEKEKVDLAAYAQAVFNPIQRLKEIADVSSW